METNTPTAQEYLVTICRTGYGHRDIPVTAENPEQAEELALEQAGNLEFREHTSEYAITACAPAAPRTTLPTIPVQLDVTFRDAHGNVIERFTADSLDAGSRAARFLHIHGTDPDAEGQAARAGTIEFTPVRTAH